MGGNRGWKNGEWQWGEELGGNDSFRGILFESHTVLQTNTNKKTKKSKPGERTKYTHKQMNLTYFESQNHRITPKCTNASHF